MSLTLLSRVGDTLLAINNESLSGKPVSFVRNVIRSVPRGEVQLLARAGTEEETPIHVVGNQNTSPSTQQRRDNDAESFVTTTTTAMAHEMKVKRQLDEPDPTEFALPLPSKDIKL